MLKTNKTYQVYVANEIEAGVLKRGSKKEMTAFFNACKDDPEYETVVLQRYNEKYNCWYAIEKHNNYNGEV